jgi:hypothetical protein
MDFSMCIYVNTFLIVVFSKIFYKDSICDLLKQKEHICWKFAWKTSTQNEPYFQMSIS